MHSIESLEPSPELGDELCGLGRRVALLSHAVADMTVRVCRGQDAQPGQQQTEFIVIVFGQLQDLMLEHKHSEASRFPRPGPGRARDVEEIQAERPLARTMLDA